MLIGQAGRRYGRRPSKHFLTGLFELHSWQRGNWTASITKQSEMVEPRSFKARSKLCCAHVCPYLNRQPGVLCRLYQHFNSFGLTRAITHSEKLWKTTAQSSSSWRQVPIRKIEEGPTKTVWARQDQHRLLHAHGLHHGADHQALYQMPSIRSTVSKASWRPVQAHGKIFQRKSYSASWRKQDQSLQRGTSSMEWCQVFESRK